MSAAAAVVVRNPDTWESTINGEPDNPSTPSPAIMRLLAAQATPSMVAHELLFEDVDGNRHPIISSFRLRLDTGITVRVYYTDYFTLDDGPFALLASDMGLFRAITMDDESEFPIVVKHQNTIHNISVLGVETDAFVLSERNDFSAPQMLLMPDERNILPFLRELEAIMFVV